MQLQPALIHLHKFIQKRKKMKPEEELGQFLIDNNITISTAESCTGGLLSSKLTDISGDRKSVV